MEPDSLWEEHWAAVSRRLAKTSFQVAGAIVAEYIGKPTPGTPELRQTAIQKTMESPGPALEWEVQMVSKMAFAIAEPYVKTIGGTEDDYNPLNSRGLTQKTVFAHARKELDNQHK